MERPLHMIVLLMSLGQFFVLFQLFLHIDSSILVISMMSSGIKFPSIPLSWNAVSIPVSDFHSRTLFLLFAETWVKLTILPCHLKAQAGSHHPALKPALPTLPSSITVLCQLSGHYVPFTEKSGPFLCLWSACNAAPFASYQSPSFLGATQISLLWEAWDVFPSSAGHRPEQKYLHSSCYLIIQHNCWAVDCTGQHRTSLWVDDSVFNHWALWALLKTPHFHGLC